jgi:hypothetical protein
LRAQDHGRVGASGTFVEVGVHLLGDNVFGECLQQDYSLLFILPERCWWEKIATASFLHCTERDDYTDKRYVD